MSVRMRAALVGAALTLGLAPVAEAGTTAAASKTKAGKSHKGGGSSDARNTSRKLRSAITDDGMFKHLQALQMIADENGGNRASGFQGYGASVQYVLTKLRDAGYNPTTQVFDFVTFEETADPTLIAGGKTYTANTEFITMSYSASGDTGTQAIHAVDLSLANPAASTSGCQTADFTGFPAGAIALMQRGECAFAVKVTNAQAAGASGAIIMNQGTDGRTDVFAGTLGETAQDGQATPPDVTIPAVGISFAEGQRLAALAGATGRRHRRERSPQVHERPRGHPRGQPGQRDDRGLAPRFRDRGSRHQRQRLGLVVQPRAGPRDGQEEHQAREPRALRLVGRRGVGSGGRHQVRRGHLG
jgi:PA domain